MRLAQNRRCSIVELIPHFRKYEPSILQLYLACPQAYPDKGQRLHPLLVLILLCSPTKLQQAQSLSQSFAWL